MAAEYKVLHIDEMHDFEEGVGVIKFYRHRIKTKGDTILTVDIKEKDFVAEKAAPILLKRAVEADKILAL